VRRENRGAIPRLLRSATAAGGDIPITGGPDMKRIALTSIVVVLIAAMAVHTGLAIAGDLSFSNMNSVSNSNPFGYGSSKNTWACQVTSREGTGNINAVVQGTINRVGFVNMGDVHAIDTNDQNYFMEYTGLFRAARIRCTLGCDLTNTITGICIGN
jgi:hypothetical protein